MCRALVISTGLALGSAIAATCFGADTWKIKNNLDRDFVLILYPAGGGESTEHLLNVGAIVSIELGADQHEFATELRDGQNKQRQLSDRLSLRKIADGGTALLKDIRSPIGIQMPITRQPIYQAMPDFPYSKNYETLLEELRKSKWVGTYGNNEGSLQLNGDSGTANSGTKLKNVQYVPGESSFIIAGEWTHDGQKGEFILVIDPAKPKQLTGFYRSKGNVWHSGTAKRR